MLFYLYISAACFFSLALIGSLVISLSRSAVCLVVAAFCRTIRTNTEHNTAYVHRVVCTPIQKWFLAFVCCVFLIPASSSFFFVRRFCCYVSLLLLVFFSYVPLSLSSSSVLYARHTLCMCVRCSGLFIDFRLRHTLLNCWKQSAMHTYTCRPPAVCCLTCEIDNEWTSVEWQTKMNSFEWEIDMEYECEEQCKDMLLSWLLVCVRKIHTFVRSVHIHKRWWQPVCEHVPARTHGTVETNPRLAQNVHTHACTRTQANTISYNKIRSLNAFQFVLLIHFQLNSIDYCHIYFALFYDWAQIPFSLEIQPFPEIVSISKVSLLKLSHGAATSSDRLFSSS